VQARQRVHGQAAGMDRGCVAETSFELLFFGSHSKDFSVSNFFFFFLSDQRSEPNREHPDKWSTAGEVLL
jgi:hypothetical protein